MPGRAGLVARALRGRLKAAFDDAGIGLANGAVTASPTQPAPAALTDAAPAAETVPPSAPAESQHPQQGQQIDKG